MHIVKKYKEWIKSNKLSEAIVDDVSEKLSDIFTPNGKMKLEVRQIIDKGVEIIKKEFPNLKILDYFVVGAAVTYQYKAKSDIDVTVVIDASTPEDFMISVDKWIESNLDATMYHTQNGTVTVSPGTKSEGRPYQFKIGKKDRYNNSNADAAYDSIKDTWIKKPDLEQSKKSFQQKIKNKNSLENKTYSKMEKWVQPVLKELLDGLNNNVSQNNIKKLILKAYDNYETGIKKIRKKAYSTDIEQGMSSQNWGKGNVVYKMFDKEGYNTCYEIMKSMKNTGNFDDHDQIEELKNNLQKVVNDEIGFEPND
jgi:hypothetical protein